MVVAGGKGEDGGGRDEVMVLEGVGEEWIQLEGRLQGPTWGQAGVVLGDLLLCLGGYRAEVGRVGLPQQRIAGRTQLPGAASVLRAVTQSYIAPY